MIELDDQEGETPEYTHGIFVGSCDSIADNQSPSHGKVNMTSPSVPTTSKSPQSTAISKVIIIALIP